MLYEINDLDVDIIEVSRDDRFGVASSSYGNQIKWIKGDRYIKKDLLGYESVAEVLVSYLLCNTDLRPSIDFVIYYPCIIVEDGKNLGNGCYSYDYTLRDGVRYSEVSIGYLLKSYGRSFGIGFYDLVDFLYDKVHFNVSSYLGRILCLDTITRNDDRHFNNISFLYKDGIFIPSPIYDNGGSCMSDTFSYPLDCDFDTNYNSIMAKPFKENFLDQLYTSDMLYLNYDKFVKGIHVYSDIAKRAVDTVLRGLKETEGKAWQTF